MAHTKEPYELVYIDGNSLDTALLNTREHLDLCIGIREAGGSILFEPASTVTYKSPPPLARRSLVFWRLSRLAGRLLGDRTECTVGDLSMRVAGVFVRLLVRGQRGAPPEAHS